MWYHLFVVASGADVSITEHFRGVQDAEGFLDEKDIEGFLDDDDMEDEDDEDSEDEDGALPLIDDSMLDFMPNIDGEFAPTVREPWRQKDNT